VRRGKLREFKSIEERCNACKLSGGNIDPCMHPAELASYRRETKRECPRVQLFPENSPAFELANWAMSERLRGLAMARFDAMRAAEGWGPCQVSAVLRRIAAVTGSDEIQKAIDARSKEEADAKG
jgi:hypothetical protein